MNYWLHLKAIPGGKVRMWAASAQTGIGGSAPEVTYPTLKDALSGLRRVMPDLSPEVLKQGTEVLASGKPWTIENIELRNEQLMEMGFHDRRQELVRLCSTELAVLCQRVADDRSIESSTAKKTLQLEREWAVLQRPPCPTLNEQTELEHQRGPEEPDGHILAGRLTLPLQPRQDDRVGKIKRSESSLACAWLPFSRGSSRDGSLLLKGEQAYRTRTANDITCYLFG
jgi:hypothetical protein